MREAATRIFLLRHGTTGYNREGRYQGHRDIELNEEGRRQARLLTKYLQKEELAAVYSSDLRRAVATAEPLAESKGVRTKTSPLLREINFGLWEGLTFAEIERDYPEQAALWLEAPHMLCIPQGESFEAAGERAFHYFCLLAEAHYGQKIAVVTHGGIICLILSKMFGLPLERMWQWKQDNGALNIIDAFSGHMVLSLCNYTGYFD